MSILLRSFVHCSSIPPGGAAVFYGGTIVAIIMPCSGTLLPVTHSFWRHCRYDHYDLMQVICCCSVRTRRIDVTKWNGRWWLLHSGVGERRDLYCGLPPLRRTISAFVIDALLIRPLFWASVAAFTVVPFGRPRANSPGRLLGGTYAFTICCAGRRPFWAFLPFWWQCYSYPVVVCLITAVAEPPYPGDIFCGDGLEWNCWVLYDRWLVILLLFPLLILGDFCSFYLWNCRYVAFFYVPLISLCVIRFRHTLFVVYLLFLAFLLLLLLCVTDCSNSRTIRCSLFTVFVVVLIPCCLFCGAALTIW